MYICDHLKFQDVFVFFIVLITLAIYLKIPNRVFQIKLAHAVSRTHLTYCTLYRMGSTHITL